MEIFIIHESSIGDDDATEYRAECSDVEIERRRGCINYGAVSAIRMNLATFIRFMDDGKFSYALSALDESTLLVREFDSMLSPEDAVTIHADSMGMFDLAPLGWEFYPAERYLYTVPFRSEYRNGGQW
jgi:hypothetical protein